MENLSKFCTCRDHECPMHPTNHDKGCAPCIAKNLRFGEVPNCFYDNIGVTEKREAYTYLDFAKAVLEKEEKK